MALKQSASPLDEFWENQSQKLRSHPKFIGDVIGDFPDEISFEGRDGTSVVKLDFSIFDSPHISHNAIASLEIEGRLYSLSAKEYAKLCFNAAIQRESTNTMYGIFQVIVHVLAFINLKQDRTVNSQNIKEFYMSFLGESVNSEGFHNRVSAPSYNSSLNFFPMPRIRATLHALGIVGVLDTNLSIKVLARALDEACRASLGVSFYEYKKGGSFNFLGLELGQYYVDYLRECYENDYLYTLVCMKTVNKYSFEDLSNKESICIRRVVLSGLANQKLWHKGLVKTLAEFNIYSLMDEVQNTAFEYYQDNFKSVTSLNQQCIEDVVSKLGLDMRFDGVEVIRTLMLQKYLCLKGHKTPDDVWKGYLASISLTSIEDEVLREMSVDDVYRLMDDTIEPLRLAREVFLARLHTWVSRLLDDASENTWRCFKKKLKLTTDAMCSLFLAYVGYRKGELGFPYNAIHVEPNIDILDSAYIPFRFKLKWNVPKTHGGTKIDREITSQCFQLASQLHQLWDVKQDGPCLYDSENPNSSRFMHTIVTSNWEGFTRDYKPFNDAVLLESLLKERNERLSTKDKEIRDQLSEKYDPVSANYQHLIITAREVRRDLPRLKISKLFGGNEAAESYKASLQSYIDSGTISNTDHAHLIETYLSDETKALLRSGTVILDTKTMTDIGNELRIGVSYPSSHAFRHIWAEAVLTRYEGDVGTVIRHQFCHLDGKYFMAYLYDKEASVIMHGARQRYLNSLVERILLESDQIGEAYLGGMAQYLKRAKELTKTVTLSEIRSLKEDVLNRVIMFQVTPFATCIPREGSENRAKCATMGSVNPHNAKPSFCLDCIHSLITTGNIRGILITIQSMMKEARHPDVMGFMVEEHLPTLRSAYKRIKQLKSKVTNKEKVDWALSEIAISIKCIEDKLEDEGI